MIHCSPGMTATLCDRKSSPERHFILQNLVYILIVPWSIYSIQSFLLQAFGAIIADVVSLRG